MKRRIEKIYQTIIFIGILLPIFSFAQTTDSIIVGRLAVPGALRDCPSTDCEIIRYYTESVEVQIVGLDESSKWYQVKAGDDYGNRLSGWMHHSIFLNDYRTKLKDEKDEERETIFIFGQNSKEITLSNERQLYCTPSSFIAQPLKPTENTKAIILYQIKNPAGAWFRIAIDKEPIIKDVNIIDSGHCALEPIKEEIGFKYWVKERTIPEDIGLQILDIEQFSKDTLGVQSFRVDGNYIKGKVRKCPNSSCEMEWMVGNGGIATVIEEDGGWFRVAISNFDTSRVDQFAEEGWVHKDFIPDNIKAKLENYKQTISQGEQTNQFLLSGESQSANKINWHSYISYRWLIVFIVIIFSALLLFKKNILPSGLNLTALSKIKLKQTRLVVFFFIVLAITTGIIGIGYGAIYYQTSRILKNAEQLTKDEEYSEAIEKLETARDGLAFKKLGLKRQEIEDGIEANKRNLEDKLKFAQSLIKIEEGGYQEAVDLLSGLSENSFYYQKAQTKIEEAKRRIAEEQLGVAKLAEEKAEQKAQQEAIKRSQEEMIRKAKEQELASKEAQEKTMNADNDNDGLTYRRELELGTSDWSIDSDDDGIKDGEDAHPAGGGRSIAQNFEWEYGGTTWTWNYSIQEDWYEYYKNKPRTSHGSEYVTENDPFIKEIAKTLKETADKENYHLTSFIVSFIQSLPYIEDYYTAFDEYPKYPIETFVERNGDCEDTSYLFSSLIQATGIGTALIQFHDHMGVGINTAHSQSGYYYSIGDEWYYYYETTSSGWQIGDLPEEYIYEKAKVIKIWDDSIYYLIPQRIKPCYASSSFLGYYSDGEDYYSDSRCNYLAHCLFYKGYYINPKITTKFYWDSSCSQEMLSWCSKSIYRLGYFFSSLDYEYYYDSRCIQKADLR